MKKENIECDFLVKHARVKQQKFILTWPQKFSKR